MLTGTDPRKVTEHGNPHHVLKAGKGVLPVTCSCAAACTGSHARGRC